MKPLDRDVTNADRARWAKAALKAFNEITRGYDALKHSADERNDLVMDLLCDLRHWCDQNGVDWDAQLARCESMFHIEKAEDD